MPSALILVIDGLGAGCLGPYGNTWIETPALNHLAAESLLAERSWAVRTSFGQAYDTLWHGADALVDTDVHERNLVAQLDSQGVVTRLLTDEPKLIDHTAAAAFAEQLELDVPERDDLAAQWDETHLARFFAEAVAAVETLPENALLWLHTRGLGIPWDAPLSYRARYVDEDDPDPSESPAVPRLRLSPDYDPDDLHTMQCACAGQIALLDQCLGIMLSVVQEVAATKKCCSQLPRYVASHWVNTW